MRVLATTTARAIWLFPLSDMNPEGRALGPDLLEWLKKTYQFQKYPSSQFDLDKETKNLSFSGGKFKSYDASGNERYIAVGLSVYPDGLVANTEASTVESEKFLDELLQSVVKEFGLVHPGEIRRRLYFNEMDVRLDGSISLLNPKLDSIAHRISELRTEEPDVGFVFAGITFLPQPEKQAALSSFSLERKVNTDWSENRYYTRAPLQTDAHIRLLEEIESLFK